MFNKILIANRGEISVRVIRTARRLGYRTVAVYSTADALAAHVGAADESVLIGAPPAAESYLQMDAVLRAATQTGADAIHPGYGFLSENAEFATRCADAGITFIGPPAAAIQLMGNKSVAKAVMLEAGVCCVPGYHGVDQSDDKFLAEASRIGFPIMVKSAAGGGGRGMRLVDQESELGEALQSARAESQSAFGSDELLLEKAIVNARHVEIQIFADTQGNFVHLGERDCSIQRRHQKVIEESPSPAVDAELRAKMGAAAVDAARACAYVGAGTVEFLLDAEKNFYFLEMNTRLQVEHPVTEEVTGTDLVEWQILVASGKPLPLAQENIEFRGHAIEARLYAEDPGRSFLPQTGTVAVCRWPDQGSVRIDHSVGERSVVSPHYDPMIAKMIAHGATRDDARRKLASALRDTTLLGVMTNKAFLANICDHKVFASGQATTSFLTEHFADDPSCTLLPPSLESFAVAALLVFLEGARGLVEDSSYIGWRSAGPAWVTIHLTCDDDKKSLMVTAEGRGEVGWRYRMTETLDGQWDDTEAPFVDIEVLQERPGRLEVILDSVRSSLRYANSEDQLWIDDGRQVRRFVDVTHQAADVGGAVSGRTLAPLDGVVIGVRVQEGEPVKEGQLLIVLEAMKMEHRIMAAVDGIISTVHVQTGQQVTTRQLLIDISYQDEEKRTP